MGGVFPAPDASIGDDGAIKIAIHLTFILKNPVNPVYTLSVAPRTS
jgi:hypothetical protein